MEPEPNAARRGAQDTDDRLRLDALARLIEAKQAALLAAWRRSVAQLPTAGRLDLPTLNDHVPRFLNELAAALRHGHTPSSLPAHDDRTVRTPLEHGLQRQDAGLDIEEVVAEYGALRRCVIEHAEAGGLALHGAPLKALNQLLDNAIGQAIRGYAAQQALAVQKRREHYLAAVAHDLRAPLNSVSLVADVLELAAGRPNAALDPALTVPTLRRNVKRLGDLVNDVLSENQPARPLAAVSARGATVDLWALIEKLLSERPLATRPVNDVSPSLQVSGDAWLLEKLLRALIERATSPACVAAGAQLHLQAKQAPLDEGVALRLCLSWPAASGDARPSVWQTDAATDGAAPDDDEARQALKTLVDTHGATVQLETLDDAEALVISWPPTLQTQAA